MIYILFHSWPVMFTCLCMHAVILYILCLTFRSSGQEKDFYIPDGDYLAGILYYIYMYICIDVYMYTYWLAIWRHVWHYLYTFMNDTMSIYIQLVLYLSLVSQVFPVSLAFPVSHSVSRLLVSPRLVSLVSLASSACLLLSL